ncbi:MAG: hypothetical protein J0H01_25110 [Rhizobiales bacterium]|nr:hypothetical protein [Hyphomicrobiales bacterium]
MRAVFAVLLLSVSLGGCMSTQNYPSNPTRMSPSEQDAERNREIGLRGVEPGVAHRTVA